MRSVTPGRRSRRCVPPTSAFMLVPFSAFGMTLLRSVLTSAVVFLSAGFWVGIALKYAVVPALSIWIGVTA